ncbi:MAG: hypothetical protein K6A77_03395 [Clostridiales bacterium]|nr:hypothetical protein [Clostridiales bacterium]
MLKVLLMLLMFLLYSVVFKGTLSVSVPMDYAEEESYSEEAAAAAEEAPAEDSIFAELPSTNFVFASGAGGWATELRFNSDGSFAGAYHDSEMGLGSDEYDATVYVCNFQGQMSVIEKVDEYTYRLKLDWIDQTETPGEEWIDERVRYVGGSPYGLDNADELMLYLPGRPTDDLTEDCISWIFMAEGWSWDERGSNLSGYVLYNINAGEAFTASY